MQRVLIVIGTVLLLTVVLFSPASAGLKVGVATADITPPIGGKMAGYGARGSAVSQGVHDPLTARALVLDDQKHSLALVTLDLAGFPDEATKTVREKIKQRTHVDLVMVMCSHTHSGPESSPNFPSKEKPWLADAIDRIVEAAVQANDARAPATYGVAKGEAREGHNRRKVNPDGTVTMFWRNEKREPTAPLDYQVGVIHFRARRQAAGDAREFHLPSGRAGTREPADFGGLPGRAAVGCGEERRRDVPVRQRRDAATSTPSWTSRTRPRAPTKRWKKWAAPSAKRSFASSRPSRCTSRARAI